MTHVNGGTSEPTPFGKLVKRYREARGMSQERLEQLMGGQPGSGYVSQIETGKRGKRVSRDRVIAIAQALNADPVELLTAAGRIEPGDTLGVEPRPSFRVFVATDPALRSDQKETLIRVYESWVGKGG